MFRSTYHISSWQIAKPLHIFTSLHAPRTPPASLVTSASASLGGMALTSAVASNAATTITGAGKKAAQVQLQAELNTDDDWKKFLLRDGLLVVDVYSEWCGPCIGMVGNLKKIKVEIGGDNLHLAVAKSDTITDLARFRKRSEPTWMFLAAGQLLNVVFGADAPRLTRTIEQELKNEELAKKGEMQRPTRAPHELTPPEQEVASAAQKLFEERRAKEAAAVEAARLARREQRAKKIEAHFADVCPGLMMPHAQKNLRKVSDVLEPQGVIVADKCPLLLGKDGAKVLAVEDPEMGEEQTAAVIIERPSLALLLKKQPDKEGCVIEICRRALFGDGIPEEERPKRMPADDLRADNIPGIYIPSDRHQRAAILDLLYPKMVQALVPAPPPPEAPHILMMFGAWQRRAVLTAAQAPEIASRLLRYGLYADASLEEPKLLCKTADQYELRPEKDYNETIVLCIAVGAADPVMADPESVPPSTPPVELLQLGALHVCGDAVEGAEEGLRFFPPGYSAPERKPKPKSKKKKKGKKSKEEDTQDSIPEQQSTEAEENGEGETNGEENGDEEGEEGSEGENGEGEDAGGVDKATSPPPQ